MTQGLRMVAFAAAAITAIWIIVGYWKLPHKKSGEW